VPAASAATCWALNTSGSRVAVSSERYSTFSSPPRTHFPITEGSAPIVKALQTGHSRSPKYWSVNRSGGAAEHVAVLRDARQQLRDFTGGGGRLGAAGLDVLFAAAGGRDQDDHDPGDHDGYDDPEQRQPGSPHSGRGLRLLDFPAFCACLFAALLAHRLFLVLAGLQCAHARKLFRVAARIEESDVGELVIPLVYYNA